MWKAQVRIPRIQDKVLLSEFSMVRKGGKTQTVLSRDLVQKSWSETIRSSMERWQVDQPLRLAIKEWHSVFPKYGNKRGSVLIASYMKLWGPYEI